MLPNRWIGTTVVLAGLILGAAGTSAWGRTVLHQVTPSNLREQMPLEFKVEIKATDDGKSRQLKAYVKGGHVQVETKHAENVPGGEVIVSVSGQRVEAKEVTRSADDGWMVFELRLAASEFDHALFRFTETARDALHPFAGTGDYYEFRLKDFAGDVKN